MLGREATLSRNLGTSALNPSCGVGIHKIRILYFLTVFYMYCKLQIIPNRQARDKFRAKSGRKNRKWGIKRVTGKYCTNRPTKN